MYDLKPLHDAKQSFYGKAQVEISDNGTLTLFSYGTKVAIIEPGKTPHVFDTCSATTLRHIKEFLLQEGFPAKNKAEIQKSYSL